MFSYRDSDRFRYYLSSVVILKLFPEKVWSLLNFLSKNIYSPRARVSWRACRYDSPGVSPAANKIESRRKTSQKIPRYDLYQTFIRKLIAISLTGISPFFFRNYFSIWTRSLCRNFCRNSCLLNGLGVPSKILQKSSRFPLGILQVLSERVFRRRNFSCFFPINFTRTTPEILPEGKFKIPRIPPLSIPGGRSEETSKEILEGTPEETWKEVLIKLPGSFWSKSLLLRIYK